MPSTKQISDVRASLLDREGAGGEPQGEPPATPSRTRRRSKLSGQTVDDAVERARLREMTRRADGERIPDEVIDQLQAGASTEREIAGPGGVLAQLTKRLVERAMEVELTEHVGYEPHAEPPGGAQNTRNGTSPKRLIGEHGEVQIDAPRDRDGSFSPKIVRKRQRRFEGFDDKILALYARGWFRAANRAPRMSSRALSRSRSPSSSGVGGDTNRNIPARYKPTSFFASRRSVFTRSPARTGINDGATTSHATPILVSSRHSANPPGPA